MILRLVISVPVMNMTLRGKDSRKAKLTPEKQSFQLSHHVTFLSAPCFKQIPRPKSSLFGNQVDFEITNDFFLFEFFFLLLLDCLSVSLT